MTTTVIFPRTLVQFTSPTATTATPVAASGTNVVVAPVNESMDDPASFFISFNPTLAFASLATISDLKKATSKMQDAIDKKCKEVLKAQGAKGFVDDYLKAIEKNTAAATNATNVQVIYQQKRDEYLKKHPEKNNQFRELESVVSTDSSKQAAFTMLLKAADLFGAWQKDQEAQAAARDAATAERQCWNALDKQMQGFVVVYRRKKAEVDQASTARRSLLNAQARS